MSIAPKKLPKLKKPSAIGELKSTAAQGTLTRQRIAVAICYRCEGISRRDAKRLVDCLIEEMIATLTVGETLKLHDFGSFIVRKKGERVGRNPHTGAAARIQPRKVVVFRASPNMKARVNGNAPLGVSKQRRTGAS